MDNIDIADSFFSLNAADAITSVPDAITSVPDIISSDDISSDFSLSDYGIYMYIGVTIILAGIGMFLYKFYKNKNNNEFGNNEECSEDFCSINYNKDI